MADWSPFSTGGGGGYNRAGEYVPDMYSYGTGYEAQTDPEAAGYRGTYPEVDEDNPYMPKELDYSGYDQQAGQYNAWLDARRAELQRDGGAGAQAMRGALNQSQLAMQAQANARGANPGAERAALYAGGQMQRAGAIDASRMTAEEMGQMTGMQNQARSQQLQNEMAWQAMELQRQQMMSNNYNAMVTGDITQTQNDRTMGSQMIGTAVGAAAGGMSDVRAKQDVDAPAGATQDAMIRSLSSAGQDVNAAPNVYERAPVRYVDFAQTQPAYSAANTAPGAPQQPAAQAAQQTAQHNPGASGLGYDTGYALGQGLAAMSDERSKTAAFEAGRRAQDQTMRGLDLYEYNYRPEYVDRAAQIAGIPPEIKRGRQTGVMAQDLERTPLGKDMVYQDPGTGRLAIDGSQAVTTSLGLIGRLGERADDLEQRLAELEQQRAATARGGRRGA